LHFLSVADFESFCREFGVLEARRAFFSARRQINLMPNLRAETAVSLLKPSVPN
jgi:hypothetical protein